MTENLAQVVRLIGALATCHGNAEAPRRGEPRGVHKRTDSLGSFWQAVLWRYAKEPSADIPMFRLL
jgi:hypothetical protein